MDNIVTLPIKLSTREQRKLKKITNHYRGKKTAAIESGVSRDTIYNAIAGKNIRADLAIKIRGFLEKQ